MVYQEQNKKRKRGRPRKKLEDKLSKVLTTDKQKSFLRNRLAGMNKRQAAIHAGYAPSTASLMAKKITDKISCNRIFIEEAHRQGLTVEAIVGEIKRGMTEAKHPQFPNQPDNFNRRAYTDMAVKIYGGYAPNKLDVREDSRDLVLVLTKDDIKALRKYEELTKNYRNDSIVESIKADDEGDFK